MHDRSVGEVLDGLAREIYRSYHAGAPVTAEFEGRASFRVESLRPLVYEKYGLLFRRGPQIAGRLAIVTLLNETNERWRDVVTPHAIVKAGSTMYGMNVGAEAVNEIAQLLEYPVTFKAAG